MCVGNFRAKKNTNIRQLLFFAREGVKIWKAVPRYLHGLRKMPFDGIEITFSIHGNEGISVTMLNFQRFSRSLVSFRPFFLSLPIYLVYVLLCNWCFHYISYLKLVFLFYLHVVPLL